MTRPFGRLYVFLDKRLILLTLILSTLQLVVLAVDLWVFWPNPKLPWMPVAEIVAPWLLLFPLRWVFGRQSVQKALSSPYFALIGGYFFVVSILTLAFILAFQGLNWAYKGQMHGGIFYFASLVQVFCWALRRR